MLVDDPGDGWFAVEVRTQHDRVDPLSGELWAAGVAGIEELELEPDGDVIVRAMVHGEGECDAVAQVAERWGDVTIHPVDADEGLDGWRLWAAPVRVDDVLVTPAWWRPPADDGEQPTVVRIDAGRVFGSGSHQSTQLALALVQRHLEPGMSVLDVGCGSGVLAITAVLLGASDVVALDIDPQAAAIVERNAASNGLHDRIQVTTATLESVVDRFDLIVANISASVLAELATHLIARRETAGERPAVLVLSGFLDEQEEMVRKAFDTLEVIDHLEQDGWAALAVR